MEKECRTKVKLTTAALANQHQDGSATTSNLVIAETSTAMHTQVGDDKYERFYADSGANRTLHPNKNAASAFEHQTIQVRTAAGGHFSPPKE